VFLVYQTISYKSDYDMYDADLSTNFGPIDHSGAVSVSCVITGCVYQYAAMVLVCFMIIKRVRM